MSPGVVGRERELASLRDFASRIPSGAVLLVLEGEVPASLEVEEDDALRAAIAALEQIPSSTFAAVGKVEPKDDG